MKFVVRQIIEEDGTQIQLCRQGEGEGEIIHRFEASSWNDACRRHHELMGWEPYRPMLDGNGHEYPEDNAEP